MEGLLWKWTNYWNGWQTRWFVLNDGILAYYNSKEEVGQGCKGSMKVSACEIIVHPVDCSRMDIVIPGEQHMYLKAPSAPERQRWLVALGSSKACLNTSGSRRNSEGASSPDSLKHKKSELRLYCDLLMQQAHMVKQAACEEKPPDVQKLEEATTLLSATCDSFIETLEACSKLANENFQFELPQHSSDAVIPPSLAAKTNKMSKPNASS